MEASVVGNAIVRPPSRHIEAPLPEILEILRGRLPSTDRGRFEALSRLVEATTEFDFLDLRRRLKWSFRLFSDGALGKEYVGRLGRPLPSKEVLIQRELRFVADFLMLMQTAHYELLSKELWTIALKEDFELTMPIKVNMDVMDPKMLTRFWTERPNQRESLPDIADRMLVFYRGISMGKKTDRFISEKTDLLVKYLILNPFKIIWSKITNTPLLEGEEKLLDNEIETKRETIKRFSLKDALPDWVTVIRRFTSKIEIQEPTFDSVVVLYRKAKGTLLPSTPNTKSNYYQAKRNIVIKMFDSVPSADLEMIFPEKTVNIRSFSWMIILVTLVVALGSAAVTIWQTDIELAVIGSVLMLVLSKAFQSYTSMQREKATMMTNISKMLYEKTRDAQDGALFTLLDDMADQHLKDISVAYSLLLLSTQRTQTVDELEKICEVFFAEEFGRRVDFCIREKLPHLLASGLVKEVEDQDDVIEAVELDTAMEALTKKWGGYHQKLGNLDADVSLFDSPTSKPLGTGAVEGMASVARAFTSRFSAGLQGISSRPNPTAIEGGVFTQEIGLANGADGANGADEVSYRSTDTSKLIPPNG